MDFRWRPNPLQLTPVTRTAVQPAVQQPGILSAPDVHEEYRVAEELANSVSQTAARALRDEEARKDSLLAEYRQNEARIADLELRLNEAVNGNAAAADALDMKLARNRAEAGDIANAYAHLNRIDTRRMAGARSSGDGKLAGIVENLENAYIMRNSEKDAAAQAGWDNKIRRLSKEYKDITGKPYEYAGTQVDTANYADTRATNFMQLSNKIANMKAMRKDGRLTESQIDSLALDIAGLPNGEEKNAQIEELRKLRNDSAEKHDKAVAATKAKVDKAMAELERDWKNQKISKDLKSPGKSVTRTVNGVTFTITYTGQDVDGKKKYEISRNGKLKRVFKE